MRRLMVIVLLALLPLQFNWAAVASHCEESVASGHAAHADHAATADADTDSASDANAALPTEVLDAGCDHGHCHHHCHCVGILSLVTVIPCLAGAERHLTWAGDAAATQAPARPERPQWTPLA